MSEMEHTPTPWYLEVTRNALWIGIEKAAGGKVGEVITSLECGEEYNPWFNERARANAAYIVECVNSHASLVEENARLREALEGVVSICTDRNGKWHGTYFIEASKLYDAYIKAREALK